MRIKLSMKEHARETPDVRIWLDQCEAILNKEQDSGNQAL